MQNVEDTTRCSEDGKNGVPKPSISKSSQKKLNRLRYIKEHRAERRKFEKEKRKAKRKLNSPHPQRVIKTMEESACKQRIAIDLQFQDKMSEKDRMHLSRQLMFCYAANRRLPEPSQLYLTSATGEVMERLTKMAASNWDINLTTKHLLETFEQKDIVYLTSESENELLTLDPSAVYVIGGLVDHNSLKNFCKSYAVKEGLRHARLPIDCFLKMNTRKVLAVNHVMEILTTYLTTNDWMSALSKSVPTRKGFCAKSEIAKTDTAKSEIAKTNTAKSETAKTNIAKSDTEKSDTPKLDVTIDGKSPREDVVNAKGVEDDVNRGVISERDLKTHDGAVSEPHESLTLIEGSNEM